jgi:NADH-quinone oxidoreductase subunit L
MNSTKDILPLYLVIVAWLLPLVSFVFLFLFKERIAEQWRGRLATGLVSISFCCAFLCIMYVGISAEQEYAVVWFSYRSGAEVIPFTFSVLLNGMSLLMLNVALFISCLVHLYSMEYMHHKKNHAVYYPYLGLFTASMALLVMSHNLLVTFMAWELVGFSSYLLVGFWFDRAAAAQAASKAFLMNRVADLFFLGSLLLLFSQVGSFDLSLIKLSYESALIPDATNFWIGLLFFIGCMAKTAQFPLNSWLPDAMEGPTPVSALLHAATMVAAGVFLLVKLEYLLTADVRFIMAIVGSLTAFFGALPALTSFDAKKILAYSTVSQLGFMMAAIGCSAPGAAYFHLITHAFFKAGLFLSVGVVIHALHEVQVKSAAQHRFLQFNTMDLRYMGGMGKRLPWALCAYVLAAAALIGLPLSSGFLSKEALLHAMVDMSTRYGGVSWIIPVLGMATVLLTAYYITRQGLLIFKGTSRLAAIKDYAEEVWSRVRVSKSAFMIPLALLGVSSLFICFSWNPLSAHHSWMYNLSGIKYVVIPEHLWVLILSLVLVGIGIGWSFMKHSKGQVLDQASGWTRLMSDFYYLDQVTHRVLITPFMKTSVFVARFDQHGLDGVLHAVVYITVFKAHILAWFDRVIIDGVISSAVYLTGRVGKVFRVFQKGNVQNYLFWVLVILLVLSLWMMVSWYR